MTTERSYSTCTARVAAVLGCVFVVASWHKIMDPPDFAKIVYNYRVVPPFLINLMAIYLPWLELLAGLALIFGVLQRGAALVVGGLALVFIAALSLNLWRGHPTICGCFDTYARGVSMTEAEKFAKMWREIGLDALFFVGALIAFFSAPRPDEAD